MLNITVVGYNFELSCKALRLLAENDINAKIKEVRKDRVIMDDDTIYRAFPTYNHARGYWVDQVIIVDDNRWEVYDKQKELLDFLKYRLYCTSHVPEEFQIQEFEY